MRRAAPSYREETKRRAKTQKTTQLTKSCTKSPLKAIQTPSSWTTTVATRHQSKPSRKIPGLGKTKIKIENVRFFSGPSQESRFCTRRHKKRSENVKNDPLHRSPEPGETPFSFSLTPTLPHADVSVTIYNGVFRLVASQVLYVE